MFDAARAALAASDAPVGGDLGKTHRGVLSAFSEHLITDGPFSREMGRLLKHAETVPYVPDYQSASVEKDEASEIVEQAEVFLAAIRAEFAQNP